MFEIGWTEILVIAVVAIVVIGPKDLPRVMRFIGQWTGKMKRMARDFQGQFNEALREADLDQVKKDVQSITKIDPLADVRKEMASVDASMRNLDKPKVTPVVPAAPAAASVVVAEPALSAEPSPPPVALEAKS